MPSDLIQSSALLPCPFCGGLAGIWHNHPYCATGCMNDESCQNQASFVRVGASCREDAIRAWNRRDDVVVRLRAALTSLLNAASEEIDHHPIATDEKPCSLCAEMENARTVLCEAESPTKETTP